MIIVNETERDRNMMNLIDEKYLEPEDRDTRYDHSPFKHLKAMAAKQKGKYYELISKDVLEKLGFSIEKPSSTDHDSIVNGLKTEIKGSTLNKGRDIFSFLQIRPNQEYDQILFSMFYPDDFVMMTMTKEKVMENIENGIFKSQHGGKKGDGLTYLYYGNVETLAEIGAEIVQETYFTNEEAS